MDLMQPHCRQMRTLTIGYGWIVTMAYMTGTITVSVFLVIVAGLLGVIIYFLVLRR